MRKVIYAAALAVLVTGWHGHAYAQSSYPQTTAVVQQLYSDAMSAQETYRAYARQATSENYAQIAELFNALAVSEAVQARNFKAFLVKLNARPVESSGSDIPVSLTKENLSAAVTAKAQKIETGYADVFGRLQHEQSQRAMELAAYAQEIDKQHRQLLADVRSGQSLFFGTASHLFAKKTPRYVVCANCGSTLTAVPVVSCPVCAGPASDYKQNQEEEPDL